MHLPNGKRKIQRKATILATYSDKIMIYFKVIYYTVTAVNEKLPVKEQQTARQIARAALEETLCYNGYGRTLSAIGLVAELHPKENLPVLSWA
jgi:hypothetical protein